MHIRMGILLVIACLIGACAPHAAALPWVPSAPAPQTALDAFYAAPDTAALEAAVAAMRSQAPEAAVGYAMQATLAELKDRQAEMIDALLASLRYAEPGPRALFTLQSLNSASLTLPQRERKDAALAELMRHHPNADVRATAAFLLAPSARERDRTALREETLAALGPALPLTILGPFDNDQGKGFAVAYPPEQGIDLAATYPGKILPVSWRADVPHDRRGVYLLGEGLYPNHDVLAYAVTVFSLAQPAEVQIRLSASGALKVFLDDAPVFESRDLDGFLFDAVTLPLSLKAGPHRLLIKTAQEGSWELLARLTDTKGEPLPASLWHAEAAGTAPGAPLIGFKPWSENDLIAARTAFAATPLERENLAVRYAGWLGLRALAVKRAELYLKDSDRSVLARSLYAHALRFNKEPGRAADLYRDLVAQAPKEYVAFSLRLAGLWENQHLDEKARELYQQLIAAFPDSPSAYFRLSDYLEHEGWSQERQRLLNTMNARWPDWPQVILQLSELERRLKQRDQAQAREKALLAAMPNASAVLLRLCHDAADRGEWSKAAAYARRYIETLPDSRTGWRELGLAEKQLGHIDAARSAFRHLIELAPQAPEGYSRLAELVYPLGAYDEAAADWQEALKRDPDDDKLALRLAYQRPAEKADWQADIPSGDVIEAALKQSDSVSPPDGADTLHLLDDTVTSLAPDGSTSSVVTIVSRAVTQAGTDELINTRLAGEGRLKVLVAYAVSPDGHRQEPSTTRGRELRFQQLTPGSSIVVQYRLDAQPNFTFPGTFQNAWNFQDIDAYAATSRFVFWAATDTPLNTHLQGPVTYIKQEQGARTRHEWIAHALAPFIIEPQSPPPTRELTSLVLSTIPSWDAFATWEQAILKNAFRPDPEIEALAARLFDGAADPKEKLARLQTFLEEEIRYQMDYEEPIAGVKPHAASLVLARRYGDCKDKVVLFITLARVAGIDVHFALVRVRHAGEILRDVPMQQFDHVIAYVPPQTGLSEGRFYDPTADGLDVDSLRDDDVGTQTFVFDERRNRATWMEIPFQAPEANRFLSESRVHLTEDDTIEGTLRLESAGALGSMLRIKTRNTEKAKQMLQFLLNRFWPGATAGDYRLKEVKDLRRPAEVEMDFRATGILRREGREARLKIPPFLDYEHNRLFSLESRRRPLVLEVPRESVVTMRLTLPSGARIKRLPADIDLHDTHLSYERQCRQEGNELVVTTRMRILAERVPADAYAEVRRFAEQIRSKMEEDIVLDMR